MGRVRRGGYIFTWWIGDHEPRHLHVADKDGSQLGRITIENGQPLDDWQPPKKVLALIEDLKKEGRL